ncbi:MAG: hypothetical protein H6607_11990 [Flavobacteriales bacterium]|nr:hypothetical protein [Flavobacteriales bacterium]
MKKAFITTSILLLSSIFVLAQKPVQGDLATEAQFNLSTLNDNFGLSSLRFRYFLSDNMVARLDLSINSTSATSNFKEFPDGTGTAGSYMAKASGFGVGLGIENHFSGNNRFSPFVGAQLGFSSGSFSTEGSNSDGSTYMANYSSTSSMKVSSFGIAALLGADYWVGNSFYLGTQLGFGFTAATVGDEEMTVTSGTTPSTSTTVTPGGKVSTLGEFINPSFRVGFLLK